MSAKFLVEGHWTYQHFDYGIVIGIINIVPYAFYALKQADDELVLDKYCIPIF
jgi:hypothetical protein